MIKSIAVYCGSSTGFSDVYEKIAYELGKTLAEQNISVIYGGANVGLMGAVANGALDHKGKAIGVLPNFLHDVELAHKNLTELILVKTMHERKSKMNDLCDGVIALPGGFGTMEELFEMLTWGQLGLHKKPVALLNVDGFYDGLIKLANDMEASGFLKKSSKEILLVSDDIQELLVKMKEYLPPTEGKWVKK